MIKNMISIKRLSAIAAITCGALFTITTLLAIWGVSPFSQGYYWGDSEVTSKLIPSLALLTVAFIVLLVILRTLDEKN